MLGFRGSLLDASDIMTLIDFGSGLKTANQKTSILPTLQFLPGFVPMIRLRDM